MVVFNSDSLVRLYTIAISMSIETLLMRFAEDEWTEEIQSNSARNFKDLQDRCKAARCMPLPAIKLAN